MSVNDQFSVRPEKNILANLVPARIPWSGHALVIIIEWKAVLSRKSGSVPKNKTKCNHRMYHYYKLFHSSLHKQSYTVQQIKYLNAAKSNFHSTMVCHDVI